MCIANNPQIACSSARERGLRQSAAKAVLGLRLVGDGGAYLPHWKHEKMETTFAGGFIEVMEFLISL